MENVWSVEGIEVQRCVVARVASDAALTPKRSWISLSVAKAVGVLLNDEDVPIRLDFCLRVISRRVGIRMLIFVPRPTFVGDVVETTVSMVAIRDMDGIVVIDVN